MMARSTAARRRRAADEFREIIDSTLFRALCEPVRVEIAAYLTEVGSADVGTIASRFPQDGSVISRHLACLHDAGVVRRTRRGRHVFFEVDGPCMVERLEKILDRCRALVPLCCPGDDPS
jgi:DNA-binding transcriptional ArsR family regulator